MTGLEKGFLMRANKVAILFLPFLLAISTCTKKIPDDVPKKIDDKTVELIKIDALKLVKIEKTLFPETVEVSGKVSIPDSDIVNVTARVQGRLESLPVTIGDRIKIGQTLGMLWSSDLITAAEEYKMAVSQKDPELVELSKSKLKAMGVIPSDISQAKAAFPLRAPIEGVVLDKKLNAGSAVNIGDLILTLGKNTTLQFTAEVPPPVALKIRKGMKVRFPDHGDTISALVANVSPVADPVTNLVKVRCQFVGTSPKNVPQESYLKSEIIIDEKQTLVGPTKALILTNEGERVFVQDEKNLSRFIRVPVKVNSRNKIHLNISESVDIREGRVVVGDGALLLEGVLEGED